MSDLTPDAALAILDRHAGAYRKAGRATREMVIEQGRIVAEVYAACEVAGISAAQWIPEHWKVSANSARNWKRFYEHADQIPEDCPPSLAYVLLAPGESEQISDYLFDLMRQKVKLTDSLVKKIVRNAELSESIALVADYLRARDAKPKEIMDELDALAAVAQRWRAEGTAFSPDFVAEVQDERQRRQAEADALNEYLPVRMHIIGGRPMFVAELPMAQFAPFDGQMMMIQARKAA